MGALPDTYPGYQYVKFRKTARNSLKPGAESLPAHTGYRISELPHRGAWRSARVHHG
jgi:formate dehydrogenase major subunit